jgi:hypothetical protein
MLDYAQREKMITHVGQGVNPQLFREVDDGSRVKHRCAGISMLHVHIVAVLLSGLNSGCHGNGGHCAYQCLYCFIGISAHYLQVGHSHGSWRDRGNI